MMLLASAALVAVPACCTGVPGSGTEPAASMRQAREDWDAARKLVTHDRDWRDWLQHEAQRADAWMAVQRDREDLAAGWIHDFQETASGAFRSWSSDASCDDAALSASARAGCIALQRHEHIRMLRSAARLAALTRDMRYADWAAAQLDMYARVAAAAGQSGRPALFRQALDDANAMPPLADAVRLLRPLAGAGRADRWCTALLQPLAAGLAQMQRQVHNIAVWYASAAAIAGMECEDPQLLQHALQGSWSLERLLAAGASADGFWFELSLGYQYYVVQAVHEALLAASLRQRDALLQPLHEPWRRLLLSPLQVQFSGGEGPTINDSNRHPLVPDPALLQAVRRIYPSPPGVWAARSTRDWETLLDPPAYEAPPPLPPGPGHGAAEIPGLKSLLLRDGQWQALLRAGQIAPFHAHQDTLSMELKHAGTWLFRHSVTPAYGSELHRRYYKLALAHNTPLVNGLGVSNWFSRPAAVLARDSTISAAVDSYQRGVGVQRQLEADDGLLTDVMQFSAQADHHHRFGAIWHTDCKLGAAAPSAPALSLPASAGYAYLRVVGTWQGAGSWTARLECGDRSFGLRLLASHPYSLSLLSAPALGPARQRSALLVDMPAAGGGWIKMQLEAAAPLGTRARR